MGRTSSIFIVVAVTLAFAACQTDVERSTGATTEDSEFLLDPDNVLVEGGLAWTFPSGWFVRQPLVGDANDSIVVVGPSRHEIEITAVAGEPSRNRERAEAYLSFLYPGAEERTVQRTFSNGTVTIPLRVIDDADGDSRQVTAVFGLERVLVAVTGIGSSGTDPDIVTVVEALLGRFRPVEHEGQMRERRAYTFIGYDDGWRWHYDLAGGSVFYLIEEGATTQLSLSRSDRPSTASPFALLSRLQPGLSEPEVERFDTSLPINGRYVAFTGAATTAPDVGRSIAFVGNDEGIHYEVLLRCTGSATAGVPVSDLVVDVNDFLFGHVSFAPVGGGR